MGIVKTAYAIILTALVGLVSCNNTPVNVPFPFPDGKYPQPASRPLRFGPARKLNWVTARTGGLKPEIKPLDIGALPTALLDSSGFAPPPRPVRETAFDFNSLPDTAFNLDAVPSKPLGLKMTAFATPPLVKTAPLPSNTTTGLSIMDFGREQGFRGRLVTAMLRDRNGLLWIAGDWGLSRYDGEYMQTYISTTIAQIITSLAEDRHGRIWYITQFGGIGVVDPKNGTIGTSAVASTPGNDLSPMMTDAEGRIWVSNTTLRGVLIIDPETLTFKHLDQQTGLSSALVSGALEDSSRNIWLSTAGGGVDILDLRNRKIRYLGKAAGLITDTLWTLTLDKAGKVLVARPNGVDIVDPQGRNIKEYTTELTTRDLSFMMMVDDRNRVWVGTISGVVLLDLGTGWIRHLGRTEGLSGDVITSILQDKDKRVWIGAQGGMNIIDQYGDIVHRLGKKSVTASLEDQEGKIWAGLSGTGILILDRQNNRAIQLDKRAGLGDGFIQAFAALKDGIGVTSDGGLDIVDFSHKRIEHIGRKQGLPSDTIYTIITDNHDNLWLSGPQSGLVFIDSAKETMRYAQRAEGLSDNAIIDVKQDKQGLMWIATYAKGIDVLDPATGSIRNLSDAPGLRDTSYRLLMPDPDGRMWIGTDKGLYVADAQKGTLFSITTKEGLSNNHVLSLSPYKGSVLVGTDHRVNIITPTAGNWQIAVLAGSEGLNKESNSWNTDMVTREGEFLWGDNGITFIKDIKADRFPAETFVTGIQVMSYPQYFADTAATATPEWKQGLRWDSVSGPYNLPVNLHIPYDQNYLQFQFTQANLGRPDTTLYCYTLEGVDKQWSAPADNPVSENYLNLSPGTYTFKVSSKRQSGGWSTPTSFRFVILPPWWQTWWAYLLLVLLAAAALWGFIFLRSQRLVKENKRLEQRIKDRTAEVLAQRDHLEKTLAELQTTQKQLMQSEKMASLGELTAGIAHEIQNPLNFVNNFAEVSIELTEELKEELDKLDLPAESKTYIGGIADDLVQNQQKINFHGKRADSIIKGMLQHSRTSTGQREPSDVNALADEYLRLSYHGLRAKDKSFNAKMETAWGTDLPKINVVPQDVGRVLLNLFTNAFYSVMQKRKVAPAGYQPTVSVTTRLLGSNIEIRVRDNGMGIPQGVLDKIYNPFYTTKPTGEGTGLGLSLSYDIITKGHNGSIRVETAEGEFAEFIILLPLQ